MALKKLGLGEAREQSFAGGRARGFCQNREEIDLKCSDRERLRVYRTTQFEDRLCRSPFIEYIASSATDKRVSIDSASSG